mmetsp:Transcript_8996/g.23261  ORF Transcript_8996/g.23261 Transcript_8996/m.23261 type:complete len:203 (-) Transcript_8996:755-1363(-)
MPRHPPRPACEESQPMDTRCCVLELCPWNVVRSPRMLTTRATTSPWRPHCSPCTMAQRPQARSQSPSTTPPAPSGRTSSALSARGLPAAAPRMRSGSSAVWRESAAALSPMPTSARSRRASWSVSETAAKSAPAGSQTRARPARFSKDSSAAHVASVRKRQQAAITTAHRVTIASCKPSNLTMVLMTRGMHAQAVARPNSAA